MESFIAYCYLFNAQIHCSDLDAKLLIANTRYAINRQAGFDLDAAQEYRLLIRPTRFVGYDGSIKVCEE